MSEYRIRLQDRFSSVFGIVAKNVIPAISDLGVSNGSVYGLTPLLNRIDPRKQPNTEGRSPYKNPGYFVDDDGELRGDLGNPMFDIIELTHTDLPGGAYLFDFPVMITLSRDPNIGVTIVNENFEAGIQPGEVVESFGFKPWRIRVRGLLVDMEEHQFPLDKINEVNRALMISGTYGITSLLLDAIDVQQVYVSGAVEFIPAREFKDTVEFQVTFSSHEPLEAFIID